MVWVWGGSTTRPLCFRSIVFNTSGRRCSKYTILTTNDTLHIQATSGPQRAQDIEFQSKRISKNSIRSNSPNRPALLLIILNDRIKKRQLHQWRSCHSMLQDVSNEPSCNCTSQIMRFDRFDGISGARPFLLSGCCAPVFHTALSCVRRSALSVAGSAPSVAASVHGHIPVRTFRG